MAYLSATALAAASGGLTACGGSAELRPGPGATESACVAALALAPERVLDQPRTTIETPGALAWGSPAIVLRCGLDEIGPTTATCLNVDDVDWVIEADSDPMTAISYGRSPAVEIRMPASYGRESLPAAMVDLGPVAAAMPATGRACIG